MLKVMTWILKDKLSPGPMLLLLAAATASSDFPATMAEEEEEVKLPEVVAREDAPLDEALERSPPYPTLAPGEGGAMDMELWVLPMGTESLLTLPMGTESLLTLPAVPDPPAATAPLKCEETACPMSPALKAIIRELLLPPGFPPPPGVDGTPLREEHSRLPFGRVGVSGRLLERMDLKRGGGMPKTTAKWNYGGQ